MKSGVAAECVVHQVTLRGCRSVGMQVMVVMDVAVEVWEREPVWSQIVTLFRECVFHHILPQQLQGHLSLAAWLPLCGYAGDGCYGGGGRWSWWLSWW